MQRSEFISKQTQEEITADLESKCPLSHAVSGSCDHNGGVITSEHGDLKLTIPKGAIKEGDVVTFSIASDLYGPFVLPSKCQADLVSPYYWIGVSGSYHFDKLVQVEFEHYAVVTACDPSHYQLLSCEDDDKSYIMQPVDCDLNFTVQGDISLCTFETCEFCSYCLYHGCKDTGINRIAAIYLKNKDFQYSNYCTAEIWFSFSISYCIQRNEELYTQQDMILDKKGSYNFEASCEKSSTDYFTLSYDENISDWCLSHFRSKVIETKSINFYNYYTNTKDLEANENVSLFPPRFVVNVTKKPNINTDLSTNIKVTLYKAEEKPKEEIPFYLFIPNSMAIKESTRSDAKKEAVKSTETIKTQKKFFDERHQCDNNKPELKELVEYSKTIAKDWEAIALHLKFSSGKIDVINIDCRDSVESKCRKMFDTWLKSSSSPCWCHFIQALHKVGLHNIAKEVTLKHLKHQSENISAATSPKVNLAENTDSDSQIQEQNRCRIS